MDIYLKDFVMHKLKKNFLSFEFNEINYEWLNYYVKKDNLNNFTLLFKDNFLKTTSEQKYEELEPWIQWPSYYYGKSLSQHKLYHLGDSNHKKNFSLYDFFQNHKGKMLCHRV